jgi:hypothetical protein
MEKQCYKTINGINDTTRKETNKRDLIEQGINDTDKGTLKMSRKEISIAEE